MKNIKNLEEINEKHESEIVKLNIIIKEDREKIHEKSKEINQLSTNLENLKTTHQKLLHDKMQIETTAINNEKYLKSCKEDLSAIKLERTVVRIYSPYFSYLLPDKKGLKYHISVLEGVGV